MREITSQAWIRAIARDVEDGTRLEDVIVGDGIGRKFYALTGWISEIAAREAQDELDRETQATKSC